MGQVVRMKVSCFPVPYLSPEVTQAPEKQQEAQTTMAELGYVVLEKHREWIGAMFSLHSNLVRYIK